MENKTKMETGGGLTQQEVAKRRQKFGPNTLPKGKKTTALQMFLRQFTSPLVYILLIAAGLTWWIGEYTDMTVILVVVAVNALIGLYQEYQANKIFEKLKAIVKVNAFVIRDGHLHEIDAEDLVPGDIIVLKGGGKVPADARLIFENNLETNEALLTGESKPVGKSLEAPPANALIGDQKNMVFMGTLIERGEGRAVVTATGSRTEIGKISSLAQGAEESATPLQVRMKRLGTFLTKIFVAISVAIFLIGTLAGDDPIEMIKTTVAVAVAAIPEGLPAAISVILAVSSQNILRRKGLVRKLVAAETLGSTSVISTDKTGTLTYGMMKVEEIIAKEGKEQVILLCLALANEALIEEHDGKTEVKGESTDKAKLEKFLGSGESLEETLEALPRLSLLPFDESRKYIASFHKDKKQLRVFVNGAPETIISKCRISDHQKQEIEKTYENLARRGYRLLAAATRNVDISKYRVPAKWTIQEMESQVKNLDYLGLVAIRDPIRPDVKQTIKETRQAGIKILMVTGDHALTAKAIGLELGFSTSAEAVVTGEQLDQLSDAKLAKRIKKLEILARVTPVHKMRIIGAWKKMGAVVAMTGDGVNDAPALKAADIGVALGSGTDVAKEVSDLVLLDDSFSTITAAVSEGRAGFANIRKATVAVMSNAFTEILLITASIALNTPFPITAIQILWVNLAEDALPILAMAFERPEPGIMKTKPITPAEPILAREHKFLIFVVSVIGDVALVVIFLYLLKVADWPLPKIQSLIFVAAATPTLLNVFAYKSFQTPLWRLPLFANKFLVWSVVFGFALMFAAVYLPVLGRILKTAPLPFSAALFAFVLFPLLKLILVELTKLWYRKKA